MGERFPAGAGALSQRNSRAPRVNRGREVGGVEMCLYLPMTRRLLRKVCGVAVLVAATTVLSPAKAIAQPVRSTRQAMQGNLVVAPGSVLRVGYDLTMPGDHPAAAIRIGDARVIFSGRCAADGAAATFIIRMDSARVVDPQGDGASWFPSADAQAMTTYQGSRSVPDLCGGGMISLQNGGAFAANLLSSDNADRVNLRWHYSTLGSTGRWSGTWAIVPTAAPKQPAAPVGAGGPTQIVVKVDLPDGYTISDITTAFPVTVDDGGLASRGIYLVEPTSAQTRDDAGKLTQLATQINGAHGVRYAHVDLPVQLADTQFHGWPFGAPTTVGTDESAFLQQPAVTTLGLAAAQQRATGAGVTVAVLDTGADPTVAPLAGGLLPGWNYVKDNAYTGDVGEASTAAHPTAVGHGTFVAAMVRLVAPDARIIPMRVLNTAGNGTIYAAAQAVLDAVADGADIINISFGTSTQPTWNVPNDAIAQARAAGVIVVAAAGNDGTTQHHFPAAQPQVFSVGAADPSATALANFSDYGDWVSIAAPGVNLVGPLPNDTYATWGGTSMAAPLIAGAAALVRSEAPTFNADKVIQAMADTAVPLPQHAVHYGTVDITAALDYASTHH